MTAAVLPLILMLQTPAAPAQLPAAGCVATGDPVVMAMCMGDEMVRRGDVSPKGSAAQAAAWRGAADEYRRAATLARDAAAKKNALEQLVLVYDEQHLAQPGDAEPVLRELIAASPTAMEPIFRLAKVQEGQNMLDAAESTLLAARQQHPDAPEPYRELAEFFGRRAAAIELSAAADKQAAHQDPSAAPQPQPQPQAEPGTADENGIYTVGGSIAPPALVSTVPADAPEAIRAAAGVDALVCEIVIDETGRVRDAKIMKSVPMLDDVAITAVRQWRYAPTIVDGRPVPVRMTVTVPFSR
jgi:TonB family protein